MATLQTSRARRAGDIDDTARDVPRALNSRLAINIPDNRINIFPPR
jgi:hypothetical protein